MDSNRKRRASDANEVTIENVQEFVDIANPHCTDTSFADDDRKKYLNPSIQIDKELHSSKRLRLFIPIDDNKKYNLKSEEAREISGKPEVRSNSEARDNLKDTNIVMNDGMKEERRIYDPLAKSSAKTLLENESLKSIEMNPSFQNDKELLSSKRLRPFIPIDDNKKYNLKSEEAREVSGKPEVRSNSEARDNLMDTNIVMNDGIKEERRIYDPLAKSSAKTLLENESLKSIEMNPSFQIDKELLSSKQLRPFIPIDDNKKYNLKSEEAREVSGKPVVRSNLEAQDSLMDTNIVMNDGMKEERRIYDPLAKSSAKTLLENSLAEQQKPEGKSDAIVSEARENSKTLLDASIENRTSTVNEIKFMIPDESNYKKEKHQEFPTESEQSTYSSYCHIKQEFSEISHDQLKRNAESIELSDENGLDDSEIKDPPQEYLPGYIKLSTNYDPSLEEVQLLSRGYYYAPPREAPKFYEFIPLIEEFLTFLPEEKICKARKSLSEKYKKQLLKLIETMKVNKPNNYTINRDMKELINQLKRNDNIKILRADESEQFVILDRKDYDKKLQETLLHLNYEEHHGTDPTLRALRKLNEFKNSAMLPDNMKKYCTKPMYPSVPQLFTRIQLHRLNKPLRPFISTRSFPTYYLEQGLVEYLRKFFPPNTYTVESPKEYLERLKTVQLEEHHKFVTLNILTHKIPAQVSIDLIQEELMQNATIDISEKEEVIKALNFLVNEKYCQVNKKIYHQTFGIPLGGLISSILLDVLLRSIESTITTGFMSPKLYMRFEDNIFIIWKHSEREFDIFCDKLFPRNSAIKFTKHETELYRKSTSISPFIQYDNFVRYKLFERAYIHSSNERNRNEELSVLYEHVKNMGYPNRWMMFIVHLVENFRDKILRSPKAQPEEEGYVLSIPNIPWLIEELQTQLDQYEGTHCKLSISETTLGKLLVEYVEPSGGVYLIISKRDTDGKEKIYIGKTKRQLTQRIQEHKDQIWRKHNTIGLYRAVKENFEPQFDETVIICSPPTENQLECAEDILIYANKERVCNKQIRTPAAEWKYLLDYFKEDFNLTDYF